MPMSSSRTLPLVIDTSRRPHGLGATSRRFIPTPTSYPLFIGDNVHRVDGVVFVAPVTPGARFLDRSALQVSRRNNHTQNYPQTAVAKFLKVLHFLKELP